MKQYCPVKNVSQLRCRNYIASEFRNEFNYKDIEAVSKGKNVIAKAAK